MNVTFTKRTIKGMAPRHSVLLRGRHGLGKSQVVAQCARELSISTGHPYFFIDIRLSQREPGDIIGMPRSMATYTLQQKVFENGKIAHTDTILQNTMVHDIPAWFPRDPQSCGILLLDEIDRAPREVQQAGFEIVLDYRLNLHELPEGWRVVACANADMDVYTVLQMDPALLDRFQVIDFKPTKPEWDAYAASIGVHDAIIKYLSKFPSDLHTPEGTLEANQVYQSPRAWVMLSEDICYMAAQGDNVLKDYDYLTLLAKGRLGSTLAVNFVDFVQKDYRVMAPRDILDNFSKHAEEFSHMEATEVAFYNKEIIKWINNEHVSLNPRQCANLFLYFKAIPKEQAEGFWDGFINESRNEATKWYRSDPNIAKYIRGLLGKKTNMSM